MLKELLAEYLVDNFCYHPDGSITRLDRVGGLGSLDNDGYLIIKIKGYKIKSHRLAWFLNYGAFPDGELDHINRVKTDNRIENLREATREQNVMNTARSVNKDTGVVGVYVDRCTKGLKKKYTFHKMGKTYRFYSVKDAIKHKEELNAQRTA